MVGVCMDPRHLCVVLLVNSFFVRVPALSKNQESLLNFFAANPNQKDFS